MKIHSLFILKRTGVCIFHKNFTKDFDNIEVNLITPFFSAIFSFSENVISRKTPEVLEMRELRFVFKVHQDLIFSILSDSTASILFVTTRLEKIADVFLEEYPDTTKIKDYQQIENPKFDKMVDSIVAGEDEIYMSKTFYEKVIDVFEELMIENEILGAALLTTKGNTIYTSLPNEILVNSLKELEIRYMVGALNLPEMYYGLENGQKVFSRIIDIPWKLDPLLAVVLYDSTVPLGMAEINLTKVAHRITNII
ncbi:MAG: hypothetical protein ACFE88_12485 [Candidatus Hermodarchaeota archaeon]